jgi:hypothetical protein
MPVKQVGQSALRFEPLWVRVDRNRVKLGAFIVLFVARSAALLSPWPPGRPGISCASLAWPAGVRPRRVFPR